MRMLTQKEVDGSPRGRVTILFALIAGLAIVCLASCGRNTGDTVPDSDSLPIVRQQFVTQCNLSGSDITQEYPEVFVYRADQIAFMNNEQPVASFPVKEGCFEGTVMLDTTLVYDLVFTVPGSGMAMAREFIPTSAGASFIGPDSMDAELIKLVSDSPENEGLKRFEAITFEMMPRISLVYDELGRLRRQGTLYSKAVNALLEEAETASKERSREIYREFNKIQELDESYSPEGLVVKRQLDGLQAELDSLHIAYVEGHPSIGSLYRIYSAINYDRDNSDKAKAWVDLYDNSFADLFPDHPYHAMILSLTANQAGERIRDFTLPDKHGVQHTLSELTAGKMAVVDFWASWCGSCRIRSKALIPVYEKYAGDDFTVVGVALEYKNDAAWRNALAKDGYPWTNLIAIDAAPTLMANHSRVFLLDRNGTILAIDPTPADLDTILQTQL